MALAKERLLRRLASIRRWRQGKVQRPSPELVMSFDGYRKVEAFGLVNTTAARSPRSVLLFVEDAIMFLL